MGIEFYYYAVLILAMFAVFDIVVGVSNDAVNFLNSAIGSRVAPFYVIMIIAGLGLVSGVVFSSGMMEVARKGIFHPQFFTMPQLIVLFLAVMISDVILLDVFNSYGLPTSTTVSVVFELLGAAVAISLIKIFSESQSIAMLAEYINTSKALIIILGILLSVGIAFIVGAIVQFLTRLLFTFDFSKRLKKYGALWGGLALAFITYFILIKGAKGAAFITPEMLKWIQTHAFSMLAIIFAVSAIFLQILIFLNINILKPIVLIGTFALAMAFAANDLVNFIGVPMAGYHAYEAAVQTSAPLTTTMEALNSKVPAEPHLLLLAGIIMVVTLAFSKKARTVTKTEIDLSRQSEGEERFESVFLARKIVKFFIRFFDAVKKILPQSALNWFRKRLDSEHYHHHLADEHTPSFDLLRAGVNLMVASALISYATSHKLPLSTTYITFMVAMGTSFADMAWGRESAVYRVTGVLTVIAGWFMTAFAAFVSAALIATFIYFTKAIGVGIMLLVVIAFIARNHIKHKKRFIESEATEVYNLKKITDAHSSIHTTFEQMGFLVQKIRESLDTALEGLFQQNEYIIKNERAKNKTFQKWANIITANIFKCLRLLQKEEAELSYKYANTIRHLQRMVDGHRDIVNRSYLHVSNHHKGLLGVQIEELSELKNQLLEMLKDVENTLHANEELDYRKLEEKHAALEALAERLNEKQIERIKDGSSKTRLSILYYAIVNDALMLSKQNLKILEIFSEVLHGAKSVLEED
ncbi:inorganic phosphate transporter [Caldithrix abyssi]